MPGGAPLVMPSSGGTRKRSASKRPCAYGPRDADGYCPKRPARSRSSSSSSSSSAKRPCKYGPRDSDGHCPKKPRSERASNAKAAPRVRDYETVERAARQAGQVLRSKKATKEQKHEAVSVLGQAVATEVGKKVAEHVGKEAKAALTKPETQAALKSAVAKAAPVAAAVVRGSVVGLGIYATLALGGRALTNQREKEAARFADAELAKTKAKLPSLTQDQGVTLWKQYFDFKMKQPVTNSFVGK
jgi:hypothetical protein